jgi:fibronectin type 3 domain-containing protein
MKKLAVLLIILGGSMLLPSIARAATAHSTNLSWTESTPTGVTQYNVYRSNTTGGPYTLIGSVNAPTLIYSDTTVVVGNVYYYVVRAQTAAGESANSNEIKADYTLPAPPVLSGTAN